MFMPQFGNKIGVIRGCNRAPLIQKIEYTKLLIIDEFKKDNIIFKVYVLKFITKTFFLEQHLFFLEYFVEIYLVQPFVSIVDKKLLETVLLQDLEAVDVQETKESHMSF